MAQQEMTTVTARIAKFKGQILKHAIPREVLGITGAMHQMPKNSSEVIVFGRWIPHGGASTNSTTQNQWTVTATAHEVTEGVTVTPDTISRVDITVTMRQYSCLYMYTDKVADMYEDDVPAGMKKLTGQRMGLLREMIRYGALKGGTNKFYSGGTTRATVDEPLTANFLSKIARSLLGNRADMVTTVLKASPNYATAPIEAAFLVFTHTDCEHDIRAMAGFKAVVEYGTVKPVHNMELGSVGRFRFIVSPELSSVIDLGAAVGSTGLKSTGASNIDVYPCIVVAEDAWGDVALRGMNSFDHTDLRPGQKDKFDPQGQRGYIGAKFYSASFVQNDGWMAVGEVGVTDL